MAQQQDLSAILATLAQFAQPAVNTTQQRSPEDTRAGPEHRLSGLPTADNTNATAYNATIISPPEDSVADPRLRSRPQSRSVTPAQQTKAVIDPATITKWQDGLRCVTKIAAQNRVFEGSIRKMMREQRAHEMRWYQDRQALKQTQTSRGSSSARALSILQSLNPEHVPSIEQPPEERLQAEAAELATFDGKVYAAQQDMEVAITAQLKALGVPFFGTSEKLVLQDDHDGQTLQLPGNHPRHSPPVTETQLLDLRRKMVGHLEALYRD